MAVKKTLLEDIANQLNVSKTLVSMVINGKGDSYGIGKKTQQLPSGGEFQVGKPHVVCSVRKGRFGL